MDGLECPEHPDQRATKFKVKFGNLTNRFPTYLQARRRLEAWRQEVDDGVFDLRLHKKDSPLALDLVFEEFLKTKRSMVERGKIKESTYKVYRRRMYKITDYFGPKTLISEITYKAIHQWLHSEKLAVKTLDCLYCLLKEMLMWAYNCGDLPEVPRFPEWECTDDDMKMRKIISKETQNRILAKVYENEWDTSPRTYIACRWLATYINIRSGELLAAKESDLDRKEGILILRKHKSGKNIPKVVRLHQEDIALLDSLPKGMPHMPLFRYDKSVNGIQPGREYGPGVLSRHGKRPAVSWE
jgi:integrase